MLLSAHTARVIIVIFHFTVIIVIKKMNVDRHYLKNCILKDREQF